MINALVYIQAYSLMLLFICIPLIMVFSRYSLTAVFGVSAMIFLLKFLPVIWALIAWIDNTNGLAIWNGKSMYSMLAGLNPDELIARFTHSVSIVLLYAMSGSIFLGFMALSGIKASYAIANAGRNISGVGGGITPAGPAQATGAGAVGRSLGNSASDAVAGRITSAGAEGRARGGAAVRSFRGR